MRRAFICLLGASIGLTLSAAPAVKLDPVAEGFPVWQGVTPKNHLAGREITPSDLRHRITVVVELDATNKLPNQILSAAGLFALNPVSTAPTFVSTLAQKTGLPRNEIYVVSVRGAAKKLPDAVAEALAPKGASSEDREALGSVNSPCVPVYAELALSAEPNTERKYPFVYIMGPTGKEPLFKGVLDEAGANAARAAIRAERKKLETAQVKWEPFFGSVARENCPPALLKALEKGKKGKPAPLTSVAKAVLRGVVDKDAEKATNAQVVYDAIEQSRGDLILRVKLDALGCPHCITYDAQQLLNYWPTERKQITDELQKIKTSPELKKAAQIHCRLMPWFDPSFVCKNESEAKKIVDELKKIQKDIEKLRESSNQDIRNPGLALFAMVDDLITSIPTRVAKAEATEK